MAKYKKGDMWESYDDSDLFLITTNSTVTKDGRLVMGRGIAKQARDRFANLDWALGQYLLIRGLHRKTYGVLLSDSFPDKKLGLFQVKFYWGDKARLDLIHYSTMQLLDIVGKHNLKNVNLNFPGIGNGGLDRKSVFDVVDILPDTVTIWEYEND